MKQTIITTILIFIWQLTFGQLDLKKAEFEAKKDFKKGNYFYHSLEILPVENTYLYVLNEDYNIQWRFVGENELSYYYCYDSVLTVSLKKKYGKNFLDNATAKADSLESTANWIKSPEFPDGISELNKFIYDRLKIETKDIGGKIKTRIFVHFTITEKGKLEDFEVFRGVNKTVDEKVIQIFRNMPNWSPAYLYGKPVRTKYTYTVIIELK